MVSSRTPSVIEEDWESWGHIQKYLAQKLEGAYISFVAAILLTQAASRFDLGSGTPKPHTSTAHHITVASSVV